MVSAKSRRSRNDVVCAILAEALEGSNKTRLMYRCNLNFLRFNRYLQEMLNARLIETVSENPERMVVYKTTGKGRELLTFLQKVDKFFEV